MDSIPPVLFLVTAFFDDVKAGRAVMRGYDLPSMRGLRLSSWPDRFEAISRPETRRIVDPTLQYLHICNRGWVWWTERERLYPATPFLLTCGSGFKCIYDGAVLTEPGEATDAVRCLRAEDGVFEEAVMMPDWFGVLMIDSEETDRGHLLAFSNKITRLPARCEGIEMPDWKERIGSLTVPDNLSDAHSEPAS